MKSGSVVHLSQQEQRTIIEALVEQRERQENALTQTEQFLRRMTGSITEYVNEAGMRPLRMGDYDKAVLAIRNGELEAFKQYAARVPYQQESLLVEATGRPGAVGRRMTVLLMANRMNIDPAVYCEARKKYSAFRITENGSTEHFLVERSAGMLSVAGFVRTSLRQELGPRPFREMLQGRAKISA